MLRLLSANVWLALLWAILIAASLSVRPLFPVDETRYASVAWEMWVRHDFLVPYLNGETYSHKPPLLFWLMQLSWWLFGVNDWSLRLIAPLFSLATLYLCRAVAQKLWPGRNRAAELTPFLLLGFFFWLVFSTLTMFDIMLSCFALAGIYCLIALVRDGLSIKRWLLFGIAIAGGVLSKGPVILLHVLPVALLAPWWLGRQHTPVRWRHWYGGLLFSIVIGAFIALCWAIPAGIAGGEAYRNAIFLGQTSGRLVESFAHRLPWWWYLQIVPAIMMPWLLIKPFWLGFPRLDFRETGTRFCLAWALPVFIAFSLISGKRIHYLLPLMPALALLLAQAADRAAGFEWRRMHVPVMAVLGILGLTLLLLPWLNGRFHWQEPLSAVSPLWGILLCLCSALLGLLPANNARQAIFYVCIGSIAAFVLIGGGFFSVMAERYDTKPTAQKIAELMRENRAIAFYGSKYHGQYQFTGRLEQPIKVIADFKDLHAFAAERQTCYILTIYKDSDTLPASLVSYSYRLRSRNMGLLSCRTLLENPQLETALTP